MKLKRMLERVESFLSAKERERRAERDEIHKILKRLKKKERALRAAVAAEGDKDVRAALEAKRKVVHAQRKKGVEVLKATRRRRPKSTDKAA